MSLQYNDPNDCYRLWLENNIGSQGIAWDWNICGSDFFDLEIHFRDTEDACLFELVWP